MTPQLHRLHDFHAEMTHRTIDSLVLNEVSGSPHNMWRTPSDVSRGGTPVFFLNYYRSGQARIEQHGVEISAAPGSLLLFDSTQPYKLEHANRIDLLSLAVPHALLSNELLSNLDGRPLCFQESVSAVMLISQLNGIANWQNELDGSDASYVAESLTGLLIGNVASSLGADAEPVQKRRVHGKVMALIKRHYINPTYGPKLAADEMCIPVRTLHFWLAQIGLTFGTELYNYRLEQAQVILRSAKSISIQDVAFRCGFISAAHFSRRYRERFGVTPSSLRSSDVLS